MSEEKLIGCCVCNKSFVVQMNGIQTELELLEEKKWTFIKPTRGPWKRYCPDCTKLLIKGDESDENK
jgi:hypothetical protein